MKILLFGISNVGKSAIGTMLAKELGYSFYDLDEEVKKEFQMTLEEFVHIENLRWRDQKRGRIIKKISFHRQATMQIRFFILGLVHLHLLQVLE